MSKLYKQNTDKNQERYHTFPFPAFLSEVQTGNFNQCRTTENINYQRARRKDAEPIIRYKDGLSALSIFNVQLSKTGGGTIK